MANGLTTDAGMFSPRPRAFTLVELLVVISIIGLLVAVLLPALQQARFQSRKVLCMANYRQMALAMTMYADDYSGWLFEKTMVRNEFLTEALLSADFDRVGIMDWFPYLNTGQVYYCPDPSRNGSYFRDPARPAEVAAAMTTAPYRLRSTFLTPLLYSWSTLPGHTNIGYNRWVRSLKVPTGVYISGRLEENLRDINRRMRPILVDVQWWSPTVAYHTNELYGGCHDGRYSPVLYPDGAVFNMNVDFRANYYWGYRWIGDSSLAYNDGSDWATLMNVRP